MFAVEDRERLWLPLLCSLTAEEPSWLVWKNVDSALHGVGDIDSAAAPESWPMVVSVFEKWVGENQLLPTIACRHIPGGLNLVTAKPGERSLLELSVKNTKAWRGSTLFGLNDLQALAEQDPRGFRRLRPGGEGVFKLLLNGVRWGGRPNWSGLHAKKVPELLQTDPAGVAMAAALFDDRRNDVLSLADAVVAGRWDPAAAGRIERAALRETLLHPQSSWGRLRFRVVTVRSCPVLKALLLHERLRPCDERQWLDAVRQAHPGAPETVPSQRGAR